MSDSVMVDGVEFRAYPPNPKYFVSRDGRVVGVRGRVLHPVRNPRSGYLYVGICGPGYPPKGEKTCVHRMVLVTFVGESPEGRHACHDDGDPANNRLENLRWDTASNNMYDRVRHGRNHNANKTHCKRGHEYSEENTYLWISKKGWQSRRCLTCRPIKKAA